VPVRGLPSDKRWYHEEVERKIEFEPDNFYHIYTRGVEKRNIFLDDNDRLRFQNLLYLANGDRPIVFKRVRGLPLDKDRGVPQTALVAYSLMSNHFHIVAYENKLGGISSFMAKFLTAYSMYFNTKLERSGPLFCKPFKAKYIDNDDYFRWIMSYVHLNPLDLVESGWKEKGVDDVGKAIDFLKSYQYSSYPDYFGPERPEGEILDKSLLPIDILALESFEEMLKEFSDPFERPDLEIW